MEYELGRKLDALEAQNAFLASRIVELEETITYLKSKNEKILDILERAAGTKPEKETKEAIADEPTDNPTEQPAEQPTEPLVKRGRGRPRKEPYSAI